MRKKLPLTITIVLAALSVQAQNLKGKIVFSLPGATASQDSVCTLNPDGSGLTFITHGSYPRLSPDGSKVAYLYGTNAERTLEDIYFREASGSIYQFFDNGSTYHLLNFDFTASGAHIIYDWDHGFYNMLTDNPNGQSNNNGSGSGDLSDEFPRVNPKDSSTVSHNINRGLYLTPFGGVGAAQIPNTQPGDIAPAWSGDGQWIYFARQYGNQDYKMHNVYRIKPDGTGLTQITNLPVSDTLGMSLVVTKDNKWVVATARINGVAGIYEFKINTSTPVVTGYPVKTFSYLSSLNNFWLGSLDSVKDNTPSGIKSVKNTIGQLYPNPTMDNTIRVVLTEAAEKAEIFNTDMKLVQHYTALKAGSQTLALPPIQPGIYYLRVTSADNTSSQSFMVK